MPAPDLPRDARRAAEAAYRNWRIGDDGEGRLHAALTAYAAAVQGDADQSLRDRMAAAEETIRAAEREKIADLADLVGAIHDDAGTPQPFGGLIRELQERSDEKGAGRG